MSNFKTEVFVAGQSAGDAENSENGRIGGRMIRPSDPVSGEGKVGRDCEKVGCPRGKSR